MNKDRSCAATILSDVGQTLWRIGQATYGRYIRPEVSSDPGLVPRSMAGWVSKSFC